MLEECLPLMWSWHRVLNTINNATVSFRSRKPGRSVSLSLFAMTFLSLTHSLSLLLHDIMRLVIYITPATLTQELMHRHYVIQQVLDEYSRTAIAGIFPLKKPQTIRYFTTFILFCYAFCLFWYSNLSQTSV